MTDCVRFCGAGEACDERDSGGGVGGEGGEEGEPR